MEAKKLKKGSIIALFILSFALMSFGEVNSVLSKFWGTETSWGACGPNSNGDGGCSQGKYSQYFVFWIATNDILPTGETRACDCNNSGTAPQ